MGALLNLDFTASWALGCAFYLLAFASCCAQRGSTGAGSRVHGAVGGRNLPWHLWAAALHIVFGLLLWHLLNARWGEGLLCGAQLHASVATLRWLQLALCGGWVALAALLHVLGAGTALAGECTVAWLWVLLLWAVAPLAQQLHTILLLLELQGLCLLLTWYWTAQGSGVAGHGRALTARLMLLFLWASALMLFLLFWALGATGGLWGGLGLGAFRQLDPALWGYLGASTSLTAGALFALGAGLLAKLFLGPAQLLALSFYSQASVGALAAYVLLYYVYLLPLWLLWVFAHFAGALAAWLFLLGAAGALWALVTLTSLGGDVSLQRLFAVSSLVNLSLLVLALV